MSSKDVVEINGVGRLKRVFVPIEHINQPNVTLAGMPVKIGPADSRCSWRWRSGSHHAHGVFFIVIEPQKDFLDRFLLVVGGKNLQRRLVIQAAGSES